MERIGYRSIRRRTKPAWIRKIELTTDREIYGVADVYIREHGENASIHAAMRADELLDAGDLDGQKVWLRVIGAIKVLSADSAPAGHMH